MIDLAIAHYAKHLAYNVGGDTNVFNDLNHVLNLDIGHYCYAEDDKRDEMGFKFEQYYYLNGGNHLAVRKRFVEEVGDNGVLKLTVFFDYYNYGIYNTVTEKWEQDIVYIKIAKEKYYTGKQLFNRRRNQRRYSIEDLESLGFKFEEYGNLYPTVYPQLVGYQSKMALIFKTFQLEIGSFISTKSDDFKNGLLNALVTGSEELKEALNTMVPTIGPEGTPILIETWKGIYARL